MRLGFTTVVALLVTACGTLPSLRRPEPSRGPPADNECAVDIVNGRGVALAVTLYSRSANDLGVLQPSRTVRYAEECTPRSWTVNGIPRSVADPDPKQPPQQVEGVPVLNVPGVVSQTVEVRPGVVVRVVL